jgi:membrane peptidoglycan carboxypeptidase
MRKRDHSLLTNGASLLVCGLLAGLVVAAAAFPAVAMGGLAAKAGADTFDALPTDVEVLPAPEITEVYASDGTTLLAYLFDENRRNVPIAEVAPIMQQALVASEDSRFYEHNGVDMKGVARAFVNNQQGGDTQGASTLTMQYVRQVISYSAKTPQQVIAATEDTAPRKLAEIKRALAIEKKLTKEQILERYLNIASFGNGAFGIFAASQVYFGKPPSELTLGEAALIAGVVKGPGIFDPADPKKLPVTVERRRWSRWGTSPRPKPMRRLRPAHPRSSVSGRWRAAPTSSGPNSTPVSSATTSSGGGPNRRSSAPTDTSG